MRRRPRADGRGWMANDDSDAGAGCRRHPGDPVTSTATRSRPHQPLDHRGLVLLLLSGLALFHPSLFFLTGLFGGGQNTRAIHPWIGVVLFFSFPGSVPALLARQPAGTARTAPGCGACATCSRPRGEAARGRQVQCRPEDRLLVDVDPDHRADPQRAGALGPVFLRNTRPSSRSASPCWSIPLAAIVIILRLDRSRLCRDLGARHDPRHDPGPVTGGWAGGTTGSGCGSWSPARATRGTGRRAE